MSRKPRVVGLGAGSHAQVVIEALGLAGGSELVGLLDADVERCGSKVLGVPILGDDRLLKELRQTGVQHFFVGIGSVGDTRQRQRVFELGLAAGMEPIAVLHPSALISASAKLGRGAAVLAGAIINAGAQLGQNVIINTGAIVEHDCRIGDHAHIATGACLAGSVRVGQGTHVGLRACVRQEIQIGDHVMVGAGAAVVKDVPDSVVVVGVPARIHTFKSR